MADKHIYYDEQVRRLMDVIRPDKILGQHRNPVLDKIPQIATWGWGGCTPQHKGIALRESLAHINAPDLLQHAAQAKRWIQEKIIAYVDGKLPYWLRAPKYILDVIKVIQHAAQVVATVKFLISIIEKEIALADSFIDLGEALLNYAINTRPSGELETLADREVKQVFGRIMQDIQQQRGMNSSTLTCLI